MSDTRQVKTGLRSCPSRQDIYETRPCILIVYVFEHVNASVAKDIQDYHCQPASILCFGITQTHLSKICPDMAVSVVALKF